MNLPINYQQPPNIHNYNYATIPNKNTANAPTIHFNRPKTQIVRPNCVPAYPNHPLPHQITTPYQHYSLPNSTYPPSFIEKHQINPNYQHFPLANPSGYALQRPSSIPTRPRSDFLPLRRTEETATELSSSYLDEPVVLEDFVDLEGQFSRGIKCQQQVEYWVVEEGEQSRSQYCRKWC